MVFLYCVKGEHGEETMWHLFMVILDAIIVWQHNGFWSAMKMDTMHAGCGIHKFLFRVCSNVVA